MTRRMVISSSSPFMQTGCAQNPPPSTSSKFFSVTSVGQISGQVHRRTGHERRVNQATPAVHADYPIGWRDWVMARRGVFLIYPIGGRGEAYG